MTTYGPKNNQRALEWFGGRAIDDQIMLLIMRMFFRGIYFPQHNARVWTKLITQNRKPILKLLKEGYGKYREGRRSASSVPADVTN
jgi:hypothetical protein